MCATNKLLAAFLAISCIGVIAWANNNGQKGTKPEVDPQTYLASIRLLDLKLTSVKEKWRKGESITVKVLTVNKSNRAVKISRTVPWHQYDISVLREDNQQAPKTPFLEKQLKWKALSIKSQEIKPRAIFEEQVVVSDLFDFSKIGTYKIVFKRQFYIQGKIQHELVSNSVNVMVVE